MDEVEEVVFEGFLTKRALKSANNWKQRWFKLWRRPGAGPVLSYSKKQNSDAIGFLALGKGTALLLGRSSINKKDSTTLRVKLVSTGESQPTITSKKGKKVKVKKKFKKKQPSELLVYGEKYVEICEWMKVIQEELDLVYPPARESSSEMSGDDDHDAKPTASVAAAASVAGSSLSTLQLDSSSESDDVEDGYVSTHVLKAKQRSARQIQETINAGRGHMGLLFKKSKKVWTEKYFVLEGTSLSYYDSRVDFDRQPNMPKRRIVLCQGKVAGRVYKMSPGKKTAANTVGFCIADLPKVDIRGKYHPRYSLCAKTALERDTWVTSIDREINRATQAPAGPKRQALTAQELRASWQVSKSSSFGGAAPATKPPMMGAPSPAGKGFKPPMLGASSPKGEMRKPPMMGDSLRGQMRKPPMMGGASAIAPPPSMTAAAPAAAPPLSTTESPAAATPPPAFTAATPPAPVESPPAAATPPPAFTAATPPAPVTAVTPPAPVTAVTPPAPPSTAATQPPSTAGPEYPLYKAKFKYLATEEDELSFKKGDVFECRPYEEEDEDAWLEARRSGGTEWRLVPANYMKLLS